MNHEESKLQKQCVAWFRAQYPQYAMLLTHVPNEGNGNRVSGAIHKGEGTVAGVPDLLLFMPAEYREPAPGDRMVWVTTFAGLGIEMKTRKGEQSQAQRDFQRMFEATGRRYVIVRSFDEFKKVVFDWILHIPEDIKKFIASAHVEVEKARLERERKKLSKLVKKG